MPWAPAGPRSSTTCACTVTHFRGQRSAAVSVTGGSPAGTAEAWAELMSALGLEHVAASVPVAGDTPPLEGIVERVGADHVLVRGDDALVTLSCSTRTTAR